MVREKVLVRIIGRRSTISPLACFTLHFCTSQIYSTLFFFFLDIFLNCLMFFTLFDIFLQNKQKGTNLQKHLLQSVTVAYSGQKLQSTGYL